MSLEAFGTPGSDGLFEIVLKVESGPSTECPLNFCSVRDKLGASSAYYEASESGGDLWTDRLVSRGACPVRGPETDGHRFHDQDVSGSWRQGLEAYGCSLGASPSHPALRARCDTWQTL